MNPGEDALRVQIAERHLHGDDSGGHGPAAVLLHGLTATRRYVLHGSRALERAGYRVISYDSRGHGASDPAPAPDDYGYPALGDDLVAVLDTLQLERVILIGHSMGGHLAARVAIEHPERVSALVLGAPAHRGRPSDDLDRWDRMAHGLRTGGAEGMYAQLDRSGPPDWEAKVRTVVLQRLRRHTHPQAVADALQATPRSAAFAGLDALDRIDCPTLVVGTHDAFDSDHPLAVAQEYAQRIRGARFVMEEEGTAPLTWRGGALSAAILDFLAD